jgi:hypothetical protein
VFLVALGPGLMAAAVIGRDDQDFHCLKCTRTTHGFLPNSGHNRRTYLAVSANNRNL